MTIATQSTESVNTDETPPPETPRAKSALASAWARWPGSVVRLLGAVLPFAYLSRQFAWRTVFARALDVGAVGIGLAYVVVMVSLATGAWRWQLMLRAYGANEAKIPPVITLLRHNLVGQYFAVLPSGVAGDAVRAYRVQDCFENAATTYVVAFVERLAGLLGLLAIAGVATVFSPSLHGGPVIVAMQIGMLFALAATVVVFALPQLVVRKPAMKRMVEGLPIAGPILARVPPARRLAPLFGALALSVVSQLGMLLIIAALIIPLAPHLTVFACARVVPAIVLITYIPLTPGGLGQRELAFAHFFGLLGVAHDAAVAASLLFFAVSLSTSVMGGACLLYERARRLG